LPYRECVWQLLDIVVAYDGIWIFIERDINGGARQLCGGSPPNAALS
jgi:hypothetical protein